MVSDTRAHAEAYRKEAADVLSAMGLRLSPEKTAITHIDEGLDFLGWHIQRRRKRGTSKHYVYTYPARKSVKSVTAKVKTLCRQNINLPLEVLLHQLNSLLGAGPPTSGREYPVRHSATCARSRGGRSWAGCAANTPE
jgi:RNA-directed DNA polymerase